jgi:hypothetical protein
MNIESVEAKLEFPRFEAQLRAVSGVWAQLQTLRRKAASDPKHVKRYREYLERCIQNYQEHEVEFSDEDAQRRCDEWRAFYDRRYDEVQARVASRIPDTVEGWCARWIPTVHRDYQAAFNAFTMTKANRKHFTALMNATKAMFDEYEKAV